MVIYGVSFDMVGKQPIVLLKSRRHEQVPADLDRASRGRRDPHEAPGRDDARGPMTHDLLSRCSASSTCSCTRVSVTELRENTFYAQITVSVNGRDVDIDSRPVDALALAVRSARRSSPPKR
jgi:bifunctional DNase/RNase